MITLLQGRWPYWLPRLHFAWLLLVFGELVAWQNASNHSVLDWLAVALIYVALAAALLDGIVRLQVGDWRRLLLVAGVFGLGHGTLISLAAVDTQDLSLELIFRPLGVQVLMFLLAFGSFRLLSRGDSTGPRELALAALTGLGWGIWVRWFPALEGVNISSPGFGSSVASLTIMLVIGAVLPHFWRFSIEKMESDDWLLSPLEWGAVGGVLGVTLLLRTGYVDALGLTVSISILLIIGVMVVFTRGAQRRHLLASFTPPNLPRVLGWVLLLVPFIALGGLGYNLPDSNQGTPWHANLLFGMIAVFGVAWVPLISLLQGFSALVQLSREGY
ncbi:MAG: hypothetical protein HC915_04260 [Anaerolineae bacterium]|nr:hypothetical protein [Anaerolineae bacterium]